MSSFVSFEKIPVITMIKCLPDSVFRKKIRLSITTCSKGPFSEKKLSLHCPVFLKVSCARLAISYCGIHVIRHVRLAKPMPRRVMHTLMPEVSSITEWRQRCSTRGHGPFGTPCCKTPSIGSTSTSTTSLSYEKSFFVFLTIVNLSQYS